MLPDWFAQPIAMLIPSLLVAVVTAVVTVRLSLKRFRAERWWERKYEAYTRIIESIYHVKAYSKAKIPEHLKGVAYSEVHKTHPSNEYSIAHRELSKATAIGSYVICNEAAMILEELENRPPLDWDDNPPWEIFEMDSDAYGEALQRIREVAKKDLGVP